jgi:hypothetical protein
VTCDILLEISWRGLQLCFRPHCNRRSARKVMRPLNCGSLNCGNPRTKSHLDVALVERCRIYYKGEGGGFPQVWAVVNLMNLSCPWLFLTPKVFQLCTNHLVLVLCRFVWIVEACQFFLVPSWSSSTPLYPFKVLRVTKRAPTFYSFTVFNLDSHLSPLRSWECVIINLIFFPFYLLKFKSESLIHHWIYFLGIFKLSFFFANFLFLCLDVIVYLCI